jgi:hypothetical protein
MGYDIERVRTGYRNFRSKLILPISGIKLNLNKYLNGDVIEPTRVIHKNW